VAIDVTVCVPWRPADDRLAAFARVMAFWHHHGLEVITADSEPGQSFNLSQARNRAVAQANTTHVIVADADTIPDLGPVLAACEMEEVIWPFRHYRRIRADWVSRPDLLAAPVLQYYSTSCGGVLVCPREVYHGLGGFDEQFQGWGFEDLAFHLVAKTFASVKRLAGTVFAFDHGAPRVMRSPNRDRWMAYKRAARHRATLAELAGVTSYPQGALK